MENEKFNAIVAKMIEKKVAQGLTVDAAIAELAGELKASLLESGLYEELRAKKAIEEGKTLGQFLRELGNLPVSELQAYSYAYIKVRGGK